jgi:hypothetical protein
VARGVPIVSPDSLRVGEETVIASVGTRGARTLIRSALDARGFIECVDYRVAA